MRAVLVFVVFVYQSMAFAGLGEKANLFEKIERQGFGKIHLTLATGYRESQTSKNLNLKTLTLTPSQAVQLEGRLNESEFDPNANVISESYSMSQSFITISPSLGLKMDDQWSILVKANILSSSYEVNRQASGSQSPFLVSAFDESLAQQGVRSPSSQSRDVWRSLEVSSLWNWIRNGPRRLGWIASVEIPMTDERQNYSIVGSDPNDAQIDLELGLQSQDSISKSTKQSFYMYYRAQLESNFRHWTTVIDQDSSRIEKVSYQRDVGDQLGLELSHQWNASPRLSLKAVFEYAKQFKDSVSSSIDNFSDFVLAEGGENRIVALETHWNIPSSDFQASVRWARPIGSAIIDSPEYLLSISKAY